MGRRNPDGISLWKEANLNRISFYSAHSQKPVSVLVKDKQEAGNRNLCLSSNLEHEKGKEKGTV